MRRLAILFGIAFFGLVSSGGVVAQSGPPALTPFRGLFDHASQNVWGMASGANEGSLHALSADGRYVAFSSIAPDLVPDDTNNWFDVFLRDRVTGTTTRVSLAAGGGDPDGMSQMAAISANGRHVAFASGASNLVAGDSNGHWDVFVRDLDANSTVRVSVATGGAQADSDTAFPSISADGRYVAFAATATTLVPGIAPYGPMQIYLRDRDTDGDGIFDEPGAATTTLISAGMSGGPADQSARHPRVSADGRYVMFESTAGNLHPAGNSGPWITHLYVYDRTAAEMRLIDQSVTGGSSAFGVQADMSDMSDDGRFVTYTSLSLDIVGSLEPIYAQVFLYDRAAEPVMRTKIVSRQPDGTLMNAASYATTVSADGRYVGFTMGTYNPARPGMAPNMYSLFVADTLDGSLRRIDAFDNGNGFDGDSLLNPSLSADGTAIAFQTNANVLPGGGFGGHNIVVATALSTSAPAIAPQEGGAGSIDVNTYDVAGWNAQSYADWIVLTGGDAYAAGARALQYSISPNTSGIAREGQIRVGSSTVTIHQMGDGDATLPVIEPIVTGTMGGDGWYRSDVTVAWAVSDPDSEIVSQSYNCTHPVTITTDTIAAPIMCEATSHGGTRSVTFVVRRDTTPPAVSLTQPVPTIYQTVVGPSYHCEDQNGYSGVATCEGTLPYSVPIDTSPGHHVFTVTSTDRAGNSASTSAEYLGGPGACAAPPSVPAHLSGWWRLDANLRDVVTNRDAVWSVNAGSWQSGVALHAWQNGGINNVLSAGPAPATLAGQGLTVAAWVRPGFGTSGLYGTLVSNPLQYHVARYNDGTLRWAFNTTAGFDWVNTGVQLPAVLWSHVAVTYKDGRVRSYVNGRLVHDVALNGTLTTSGSPAQSLTIAGRPGIAASYSGMLDEVMIFDDALPVDEIDSIAVAGGSTLCRLPTTLTLTAPPTITHGTAFQVSARLTDAAGRPFANRPVALTSAVSPGSGQTVVTDANGNVTAQFAIDASKTAGEYPNAITAAFTGEFTLNGSTVRANVTLLGATPPLTWNPSAAITYGTALGGAQLNATSTLPGTFAYSPAAGTVLNAGTQTLSVTFTPSDTAHYAVRTLTTTLVVNKAAPSLTWVDPGGITYGTALGAAQLNATASVAGTFAYSPAAGAVLDAGTHALSVTFTPEDAANYSGATATRSITVSKANAQVTWSAPVAMVYGTPLGAAQLNATANVAGTFTYSPAAGAVLGAGTHALSVTFTPEDATNHNAGSATVSVTVDKASPVVTWPDPAGITYGTALGGTQLNATANVPGAFAYAPEAGTVLGAGTHTLTASFTPADAANYSAATASVTLSVAKASPVVTWPAPAGIVYGTALSSTQLSATTNVPGTFVYSPSVDTVLHAGSHALSLTFTPADGANYSPATASVTLSVARATPVVTWPDPAGITYGTALSAAQLNATANMEGTFVYAPSAGTVLNAGPHMLTTTFTPADTADYSPALASAPISVEKAVPAVTWPAPAAIGYGTALTAAQLNATADMPGTFTYSPAAGTLLNAGVHVLGVTFTPDSGNYSPVGVTVLLAVSKADPQITWYGPPPLVYGMPLDPQVFSATANVPGAFAYSHAAGTVLNAGAHLLTATFTPADTANHNGATASITVNVAKARPTLTWTTPAPIAYGTPLGAAQLNASADVEGTFTYDPAAGTVLHAAWQALGVTFTPADTANYESAIYGTTITVTRAAPVLTWPAPSDIVYGTALGAAQLNAAANVEGTFAYSPAAGTVPAAGAQTLSVTFTPANGSDYDAATATVTLNVTKATPTITWANPAGIVYTAPLGAAQLNATASVEGTFSYSPAAGAVLNAGSHTLSVTFTPADTANFATATASVTIGVAKLASMITWWEPADLEYGMPLGSSQLNAGGANIPGSYTYSPAAGTVLPAGVHQLSVTFTPADPGNYTESSATRWVHVSQRPLKIWPANASKVFGAPLPPLTATPDGFVNGDSMASLTGSLILSTPATASSPAGVYVITASGVSSPNYVVIFQTGTLTIAPASTAASLVASPNPAGASQPVTLTATVAAVAPGAGSPAGTVSFFDGSQALGVVALSGGTASLTTNGFPSGSHSISAVYGGSANFVSSVASSGFTVKTSAASSTIAVTSSTNPSSAGQTITLTATVTAPSGLSGSVAFYDGATSIGTATLSGTTARLLNVSLATGGHAITARYLGNATIPPSVSPALAQYVRQGGSTRTSTVALSASPSPAAMGSPVTLTATVTGSQNDDPTGVVLFLVNGFVIGQGTLTRTGNVTAVATLQTAQPHGLQRVEAVYLGDATFRASRTQISLVVN